MLGETPVPRPAPLNPREPVQITCNVKTLHGQRTATAVRLRRGRRRHSRRADTDETLTVWALGHPLLKPAHLPLVAGRLPAARRGHCARNVL